MPEFDVTSYLTGDALLLKGVPSVKHPEGRTYKVPAPSADAELRLRRIVQAQNDDEKLNPEVVADLLSFCDDGTGKVIPLQQKLLGDAYQEMVDDGVSPTHIDMLGNLAVTNYGLDSNQARLVVQQAGESAARPNRKTRRAAGQRAGSKSSRASGATKAPTRSRTSTSASSGKKGATRKTA